MRLTAVLGLLAGISACSFTPTYNAPPVTPPAPNSFKEAVDWKVAEPSDVVPRGDWWKLYHDPQLDDLEARVGRTNQNVQAGFARLQQARAETRIQRASLFPTISLMSSADRARVSANSPQYVVGKPTVGGDFDLEADLSYEIDLWGRVRNTVNATKASQQASAADLATLDLSVHAEMATDYFTLRGEDAQQALLDRTVEDYSKALQLAQNLYNGGAAALADVAQAQAQLESARTQASDTHLQRAQTEHAIAVLAGENPSAFHLEVNPLPLEAAPPVMDVGLPSALLERRPDVAGAERRVAAANFNIGVARAAYFPQFSLSADFGYDSFHSSTWITAPSRMWSVGPSGVLTVFDAGRHRAQSAQAHAVFDEQVANYRNTVLVAYQEVEDNLAALHRLAEESISEAAAVRATQQALQQSQYRYKAGLVTYLEVATNENTALQAQLSNVNIQIRRMGASVQLVKALGGAWATEAQRAQNDRGAAPVSATSLTMAHSQAPSSIERWYVLLMTCGIYAINIADRYVVSTVLEPIRLELHLTDGGVAFLTGVPLALFYVTFGLPLSWLADRSNRRNILAVALIVWSAFTVLCGLSRTYVEFALARIGVGAGEAGGLPPSSSILSDCFPAARRPMAFTVLALGAPIGAWLGADMAGEVARAHGWRAAFIVLGIPGLIAGVLVYFTMREPARGRLDTAAAAKRPAMLDSLKFLLSQKAAFHVLMTTGVCTLWGWGLIWWTPTFLMRTYHLNVGEAGSVTGPIHLIGGIVASLATAWILSRPSMVSPRRVLWLLMIGIGVTTIPSIVAYWTHSLLLAKWMFWFFIPAIYFYIGPCMGLLQNLAPQHMRSMFIAWSLLVGNIFNLIVAPQCIGLLSDWFGGVAGSDAASLRLALLVLAPTGFWATWHAYMASRTVIADQQRAVAYSDASPP